MMTLNSSAVLAPACVESESKVSRHFQRTTVAACYSSSYALYCAECDYFEV
jgi:hypothetical protein